jgi:hypothetical protein
MNVENVVRFVASEIVEKEEVRVGEDVGETFNGDVDQVEMDLEKTIFMIKDLNIIDLGIPLLEQENANEDVELHAHIDGGDKKTSLIIIITPPIFSSGEDGRGVFFFCQICDCNTFFNYGL